MEFGQGAFVHRETKSEAARHVREMTCGLCFIAHIALGCGTDARAPPEAGDTHPSDHEPLPEAAMPPEGSIVDKDDARDAFTPRDRSIVDDGTADGLAPGDAIGCGAVIEAQPVGGGAHLPDCTYIAYTTSPPSSGDHYPTWVAHKSYKLAIPRGFLVHNLEHAGTVIWYNCPNGCDAEVAAAQQFIDALPVDPLCPTTGPKRRVLMVPDPLLETRWAASVWGWTLRTACFDRAVFEQFVSAHYGQGPENFCSDGVDLVDADGSLRLPPDCGKPSFDAGTPISSR